MATDAGPHHHSRDALLHFIRHLLSEASQVTMTPEAFELPPCKSKGDDQRPPLNEQFFVPNRYP